MEAEDGHTPTLPPKALSVVAPGLTRVSMPGGKIGDMRPSGCFQV